jgi:hypothetical protein
MLESDDRSLIDPHSAASLAPPGIAGSRVIDSGRSSLVVAFAVLELLVREYGCVVVDADVRSAVEGTFTLRLDPSRPAV